MSGMLLCGVGGGGESTPLLLDTVTGSVAAYSLRKLRTAYSGSAIRVRRSSDNAEQDIGFSDGVLDTASLLTFCGAGDGFVATWYDQSGNSKNATQATSTRQPQVVSSGSVLTKNSLPSLLFATVSGQLETVVAGTQPLHVFSAAFTDTVAAESYILRRRSGGSDFRPLYNVTGAFRIYAGSIMAGSTPANNTAYLFSALSSGASSVLRENGSQTASGNIGSNEGTALSISDAFYPWNGSISELILFQSDKTSDVATIESNINDYYSIY